MTTIHELRKKYPAFEMLIFESSKIWHNQYTSKIVLSSNIQNTEIWYWLGARFRLPLLSAQEYFRVRLGPQKIIYFKNVEDLDAAIEYFSHVLVNAYAPISKKAITLLDDDRKIRLKKQLYFKQYRHKVTLTKKLYIAGDVWPEFLDWTKNNFDTTNEYHIKNDRIWFRYRQNAPTIFLSDEDDLTLLKLAWGEYFDSIETIKLISDVE